MYAAADGQVLSVVQDACTGTTVTMELGNGYQAVYGQLKDLTVAEGDTVKEGEVIGNKKGEQNHEKKNVSDRSSSSSNNYDDDKPGYGGGF